MISRRSTHPGHDCVDVDSEMAGSFDYQLVGEGLMPPQTAFGQAGQFEASLQVRSSHHTSVHPSSNFEHVAEVQHGCCAFYIVVVHSEIYIQSLFSLSCRVQSPATIDFFANIV